MMNTSMSNVEYKQLKETDVLSEEKGRSIANLIYDTDPYIYPAMFNSKQDALKIIPEMIQSGDVMFCKRNLFVAELEGRIVGVVLWHKGPMQWNSKQYLKAARHLEMEASLQLDYVKKQYFDQYKFIEESWISVINVCIDPEIRGNGLGRALMKHFLSQIEDCAGIELFVLADNKAAVALYKSCGFEVVEELDGFSVDKKKPACLRMISRRNYEDNLRRQPDLDCV